MYAMTPSWPLSLVDSWSRSRSKVKGQRSKVKGHKGKGLKVRGLKVLKRNESEPKEKDVCCDSKLAYVFIIIKGRDYCLRYLQVET
jgi:hypothetical protein